VVHPTFLLLELALKLLDQSFEGLFGIFNWVVRGLLAYLDQEELFWISSNIFLNIYIFFFQFRIVLGTIK
jgi:hypothetical protein